LTEREAREVGEGTDGWARRVSDSRGESGEAAAAVAASDAGRPKKSVERRGEKRRAGRRRNGPTGRIGTRRKRMNRNSSSFSNSIFQTQIQKVFEFL
jgi:hypothetical protein